MSKFFYAKLAGINIRKNARVYLPYLLTCIFTVAGYYMMNALSANPAAADSPDQPHRIAPGRTDG